MLPTCTQLIQQLCKDDGSLQPVGGDTLMNEVEESTSCSIDVVSLLRQSLYCPLCASLLLNDPVFIQPCGHCFCYRCINEAIENGVEPRVSTKIVSDDRTALCSNEVNVMLAGDPHEVTCRKPLRRQRCRKRPRKVKFTCPVCAGPAFKWTLVRVPLIRELCVELRSALPDLVTERLLPSDRQSSEVPSEAGHDGCESQDTHVSPTPSQCVHSAKEDAIAAACHSPADKKATQAEVNDDAVTEGTAPRSAVTELHVSTANTEATQGDEAIEVTHTQADKAASHAEGHAAASDALGDRKLPCYWLREMQGGVAGVYKELLYTDVP